MALILPMEACFFFFPARNRGDVYVCMYVYIYIYIYIYTHTHIYIWLGNTCSQAHILVKVYC